MPASNNDSTEGGRFIRHRGPVTCVAEVPGANQVVSSAYDGAVACFDLATGAVDLIGYHDHLVNKIAVNADGTKAASSSSDYTIRIWDLTTRKLERVLHGHSDDVEDFVFVNDHVGVSVSRDWRIIVWNLDTGAIARIIEGHERDVLSVDYYNNRIFTSGDDMTLRAWDLDTGELIRKWGPFEDETDTCAIDPINGRAVLGCDDGRVRVFDIESGEVIREFDAHASGIKKVATRPGTGDILSAAYDQKIRVWNAEDFSFQRELEYRPTVWERSFNWSPDGQRVLAGTFDGTVLVWDAETGACTHELGEPGEGNACFNDVAAAQTGDMVTVSDDGFVRLGRLTSAKAFWKTQLEPSSGRMLANAITLDEESSRVIIGTHDQKMHLFDLGREALSNGTEIAVGEGPINCLRVAHHAGYEGQVFAACYSGAIVRMDRTGAVLDKFRIHDGAIKALRLHPSEPVGVSCSADGALLSWSFDGQLLRHFPGHLAIVDDVDIDPSGTLIASVSRDFTLNVYRFADGQLLHSIGIGRRSPKATCFVDPNTVVVTNYWGALLQVNLDTGAVLERKIAKNGISSISRGRDGLVATSYDGSVYLVGTDELQLVNTLQSMTQRLQPSSLI